MTEIHYTTLMNLELDSTDVLRGLPEAFEERFKKLLLYIPQRTAYDTVDVIFTVQHRPISEALLDEYENFIEEYMARAYCESV